LDDIVRRLVEALGPERIYLFGSQARGDARLDSDYYLMVLVRQRAGPGRDMERQANTALAGVPAPVDVVIVTSDYYLWMLGAVAAPPATVEREGRLLYVA
jgi:predicted nucleotidyltransferase